MIYLKTAFPVSGRVDVWQSEVRVRNLTPARRDKLVSLLNQTGFVLWDNPTPIVGEITDIKGLYYIGVD